jgi:hypothetical protein
VLSLYPFQTVASSTPLHHTTYARYKVYWHWLLSYVYCLAIMQCGLDLHYILTTA